MSAGGIDELLQRAVDDRVVPGVVALVGDRDGVLYEVGSDEPGAAEDEEAHGCAHGLGRR